MTRSRILVACFNLLAWGVAGPVWGGEPPVEAARADLAAQLAAEIDRAHLGQFWGAVVVRIGGEDVLRRGYGFEGPDLRPIDPGASLFDIGSVSKSLTAATALRMVDQGAVSLDTSLAEIFPDEDAGTFGAVSLRDLLGHRLGVPDSVLARSAGAEDGPGVWLAALRDSTVPHEPATFAYSNICYFLAAGVIEARSGRSFEDGVREHAMRPAGLRAAGFVGDGAVPGARATARVSARHGATDVFSYPWNWGQRGATGVVMTADDAARWVEAVWSPGFLGEQARAAMFDPRNAGYGMGWFITADPDGAVRRFGHGGATGGYRCEVAHYPDAQTGRAGVTIVVMTNERWDPASLERRLARLAAPEPPRPSKAGVYLFPYELEAGVLELSEGLAWQVMPGYRGRDAEGRPVVDPRPTVLITDAARSMWPVMVILDHADARVLRDAARSALAEIAARPDAARLPWSGGMSLRADVSGLTLSASRHVELAPGSLWSVESDDTTVIASLRDADSGRVLVTVRMGGAETQSLVAALNAVLE